MAKTFEPNTVGEFLNWAYSNLAMAHVAVNDQTSKYGPKHFSIRAKLFKGLQNGEMNIKSFFDDERLKMILPQACAYCGSKENLATDHLIPRKKGGQDIGENFVWACRTCNSSKSDTDMLEWTSKKNLIPSVLLLRRYLKIVISFIKSNNLEEISIESAQELKLPFNLDHIPSSPLRLGGLKLWVTDNNKSNYRIANWNLERPKKGTKKTQLAINKIQEIDADLLVLTETSQAVDLSSDYTATLSTPFDRAPDEHWVTIWSKWKVLEAIPTFAPKRTACCLVESPFGQLIIYGTIIPYHMAGVRGNRYEQTGYKTWELHEEDIIHQSSDWQRIHTKYPNADLLVIGDFNQTRDNLPKGYGTANGRQLLSKELEKNKLSCLTGIDFEDTEQLSPDPKKGKVRRNVDHICVSKQLIDRLDSFEISAWDHFSSNSEYMSDHNGVFIDFKI